MALADRIGVTASFADIDNDGDPDLYVTTVRKGNVLFENDGKGRFKDITERAGLGYFGHSSGAVFFDYDRDGRLDLFLVNVGSYTTDEPSAAAATSTSAVDDAFSGHLKPERTEASLLYRNLGGHRFADVIGGDRPAATTAGPATPARSTATATAGPTSTSSTCRGTTTTRERRREALRRRSRGACSRRPRGARWGSSCSTTTTTAGSTSTSPTCTPT